MNQLKKTTQRSVFLIVLLLSVVETNAQSGLFKNKNYGSLYTAAGIGGGSAHYIGDLTTPYANGLLYVPFTNVRWNATAHYTRYFTPNLGAKVSFTWARLYGDDFVFSQRNLIKFEDMFIRNLHFRNDVKEFAISGIWNLKYDDGKKLRLRPKFMPYVSAGIGFASHDPKAIAPVSSTATVQTTWTSLKQYNTGGQGLAGGPKRYSSIVPVIPLAVGFRMRLTEKLDLSFEGGYRVTLSDYIDDVGRTNYPNLATLASTYGTDAAKFSYRAGEDMHAASGDSRIPQFLQLWKGPTGFGVLPSNNAITVYDPANLEVFRGSGSNKLYHRFDSYLTTQFTITYVISDLIKCPPIK